MPEIRRYVITQTREVEVEANTHRDAIDIAHAAFEHGQDANQCVLEKPDHLWGNTTSRVKTTEVNCRRKP